MRRGVAGALLTLLAACGGESDRRGPPQDAPASPGEFPGFEEITAEAGVRFVHESGATDRRYLPETMGAGVAVFDFDADGLPDLFFVGGAPVEGPAPETPGALYRNLGAGRFADVTRAAGLAPGLLGMGVAAADVDRDGDLDLVVAGVGADLLFRNRGNGTFAPGERLPMEPGFSSSVAFLDADADGWPDLFVARYVEWSRATDIPCRSPAREPVYCTPEAYPPVASRFLWNRGDGTFEDRSAAAGLDESPGKALGVLVLDADGDGWLDVAVAHDTAPNQLLLNRERGRRFVDEAVERGFAYGSSGAPRGGMGIDGADFDGDGGTDVVVGNFALESSALFEARDSHYVDVAGEVGLGLPSLVTLAFGTLAEDLDGDGWPDLLLVNGHIEPDIADTYPSQTHAQSPLLLLHAGAGRTPFRQHEGGSGLAGAFVGRGAASGDLDGDGSPDLAITQNGGAAAVLRNQVTAGRWLTLLPAPGHGPPFGLRAEVTTPSRTVSATLLSGRSYLSSPEPVIRVGVGATDRSDVTLRWQSARVVRYRDVRATSLVVGE